MEDTKTQIKKMIAGSLFLDEARRNALLEILEKTDQDQQKKLLELLQSEKTSLKVLLKKFIKGKEQTEELNNLLPRLGGTFNEAKEANSQNSDSEKADALFNELENS